MKADFVAGVMLIIARLKASVSTTGSFVKNGNNKTAVTGQQLYHDKFIPFLAWAYSQLVGSTRSFVQDY